MAEVTFYGVTNNERLGKVTVRKTIEIEDSVARKIYGSHKLSMIRWLLKNHCPEIDISPTQVGVKITYRRDVIAIREESISKQSNLFTSSLST